MHTHLVAQGTLGSLSSSVITLTDDSQNFHVFITCESCCVERNKDYDCSGALRLEFKLINVEMIIHLYRDWTTAWLACSVSGEFGKQSGLHAVSVVSLEDSAACMQCQWRDWKTAWLAYSASGEIGRQRGLHAAPVARLKDSVACMQHQWRDWKTAWLACSTNGEIGRQLGLHAASVVRLEDSVACVQRQW